MRLLLSIFVALLLSGATANAQVYALEFREAKFAKSFKKQVFDWNGKQVLLVEVGEGVPRDGDGDFLWEPEDRLEFFIQDSKDPSALAYSLGKDGARKVRKKALVVQIAGDRVLRLHPFMPLESFHTLSVTHEEKLAVEEDLGIGIKEAETEENESALQRQLLRSMLDRQIWLRRCGYGKAAEKLEKPLKKLRKALGMATDAKAREASYQVQRVDTPATLVEAAHRVGGPRLEFHVQESTHLRILYHTGIPDETIGALLELGEYVISDFRTRVVDPAVALGAEDSLPAQVFLELFFSTDQKAHLELLLGDYYGLDWGDEPGAPKVDRNRGTHFRLKDRDLSYWRVAKDVDIQGVLLHRLGHSLARLCYAVEKDKLDWVEEGLGYELSLRYLNRSSGHCVAFDSPPPPSPDRAVVEGLEQRMAGLAAESGPRIQDMCGRQLYVYEQKDVAKAWAFMAWMDRSTGEAGQAWLRGLQPTLKKRNFIQEWRRLTTDLFGIQDGDSLHGLELMWELWLEERYVQ